MSQNYYTSVNSSGKFVYYEQIYLDIELELMQTLNLIILNTIISHKTCIIKRYNTKRTL